MTRRRITKIALIVLGSLIGLAILAAAGGVGWFYASLRGYMRPPAENAGVLSRYGQEQAAAPSARQAQTPRFAWNEISSPPQESYPMVRWWWPGAAVDVKVLERQLREFKSAGFDSVEIQAFKLGLPRKNAALIAQVERFDSPDYYVKLRQVMRDARSLGMQVDLTHFSGWPPGGPEVGLTEGLQQLVYGEAMIDGGRAIEMALPKIKPRLNDYFLSFVEMMMGADFGNFARGHERPLSTVALRHVEGTHSWNPLVIDRMVRLDPASAIVLDAFVKDGILRWRAPAGKWDIVTSYLMPSGEPPLLSAPKMPGYVVDPLRSNLVTAHYNYAFGERTGLKAFYGAPLRAIFNDSLEYTPSRLGSGDILAEFRQRRGYDLRPYLPAIYIEGIDDYYLRDVATVYAAPSFRVTDMDDRIRNDFQQTLSDLYIERFVDTTRRWSEARGLAARGQPYGLGIDVIRAMGGYTIPEVEQQDASGSEVLLKMGYSAGALYGRNLVSAESFVWINREYTTVTAKLKAAVDKLFVSGINHIVAHGAPYPVLRNGKTFGEEGWFPFSGPEGGAHFSDNFTPANPVWADLPAVNRYVARAQNLLRQGRPKVDVLIYYPFLGLPISYGTGQTSAEEPLINGDFAPTNPAQSSKTSSSALGAIMPRSADTDPRLAWLAKMAPVLKELNRRGITWGWVNEHALTSRKVGTGGAFAAGGSTGALLFANAASVTPECLAAVAVLKSGGLPVLFYGATPSQTPGFKDAARRDAAVKATAAALAPQTSRYSTAAPLVAALEASVKSNMPYRSESQIRRVVRMIDGGEIQFYANPTGQNAKVAMKAPSVRVWTYDAATGEAHMATPVNGTISLSLGPYESRFLMAGVAAPRFVTASPPTAVTRSWTLDRWNLTAGGKLWPNMKLIDWRAVDGLRYAGGRADYTTCIALRRNAEARYRLELGVIPGSASVSVNGRPPRPVGVPPAVVDVTQDLADGENCFAVTYRPAQRNLFIGRALAGDPRYRQFKDRVDALIPAGLISPVRLQEITSPRSSKK
jgi:hypothetical protein